MRPSVLLATVCLIGLSIASSPAFANATDWTKLSSECSIIDLEIPEEEILGIAPHLEAIRCDLSKVSIHVFTADQFPGGVSEASEVLLQSDSLAAVNGSFFTPDGKPLGLVVVKGRVISPLRTVGSVFGGVFSVGSQGPSIQHRSGFRLKDSQYALQTGPRLLEQGNFISGLDKNDRRSRRAGVCLNRARTEITLYATSRALGVSFKELQTTLKRKPLSCYDALNFDGGGSAQLAVKGKKKQNLVIDVTARDQVPVFVLLRKKG